MQSTLSRNHGGLPHSDVLQLSAVPLLSWWTPFGSQTGNLESFNQVKCLFPDQPRKDSESSGNSLAIQTATRHGSAQFNPEKSILSAARSSILLVTKQGKSMIKTMWKKITSQDAYDSLTVSNSTVVPTVDKGNLEHKKSALKNIEVVSVPSAGEIGSGFSGPLLFKRQISEFEYGEDGEGMDFGELERGYITVTPLAALSHVEAEAQEYFSGWASCLAEYSTSSAL